MIGSVSRALAGLDGRTATGYVDTIHRTFVTAVGSLGGDRRHGGIPGLAHGGVLFEGGEAGAELAHFAGGGTAMLPGHGLYMAPPMTYISPANTGSAQRASRGGDMHFHFHGPTYGVDDITTKVLREAGPAISTAIQRQERGMGM